MKRLLGAALVLSLIGNVYLASRLMKADDAIEAGVHAEMMASFALEDLCYFLRSSGVTKAQLVELARRKPLKKGQERAPPEVTADGFTWLPLEITFTSAGAIDQVKVAGDAY